MVQCNVDLAVSGIDGVGVARRRFGIRLLDNADEWAEETRPQLDQQDPKFQSDWRQAVAPARADTLDEALRAELAQVVPKLAEAVLVTGEVMASDDARVQVARRPVADEPTGMEKRLQETDHSVVMQLEAGDAALPDQRWRSQCGKLASINRTGQQLCLFGQAARIGGVQLLAE